MRSIKKIICVLLLISICLSFASCVKGNNGVSERAFYVMDTVFTLRIYDADTDAEAHFAAVLALLTEIEAALSRTLPESDVSRINALRTAGDLSPHTVAVLEVAAQAIELTDGAYLPTMGAVTALWQQAEVQNTLPDPDEMAFALQNARLGFTLADGVCALHGDGSLLDLGGIGKGYAADCTLRYLGEQDVKGALLSFGSSVATLGEKGDDTPFRISLRHPRQANGTVGMLTAPVGVLSVSGDYERYVTVGGERYHHVLDPVTGYPASAGIASVAVLCESGALSDALSTAFLVMGRERGEALLSGGAISAGAVFVAADGTCHATADVPFTAEK